MRQLFGALLVGLALASGSVLAGGNFKLNGENTTIKFVGSKPQGTHDGGFKTVSGTATAEGNDPTTLRLSIDIDTNSLYADDLKLTNHLKGTDFFKVKTYPKAKFVSSKVEKSGDGYTITGDLTLLAKTKRISFPAKISVGKSGLTISSQFEINRQDYGMSFLTGKINDEVKIKVAVDTAK